MSILLSFVPDALHFLYSKFMRMGVSDVNDSQYIDNLWKNLTSVIDQNSQQHGPRTIHIETDEYYTAVGKLVVELSRLIPHE